jgi:small subunit ribosomal protein S5
LIAGSTVRSVLEVAGIENALSKSVGSNNRANVAYATLAALQDMVPANKWIQKPGEQEKSAAKKVEKAAK